MRYDIAEAILAGKMSIGDPRGCELLQRVCHRRLHDYGGGQGAIAEFDKEHLSPNDGKVVFKRQLWLRELEALAAGRPLKEWKVPPTPLYP